MTDVIRARGLVKRFGKVTALDGLDLEVAEGRILGLLGPNGAGKTTVVSILTTLLKPDEGAAEVAGFDVVRQPADVRKHIGLSGQYAAVDEVLTGRENLEMIGRLYHVGRKRARERALELLERFDLAEAANRPVKTYSGGMRRRLDLAGALVAQPPVLFLDEPTTGLDPRSRVDLWANIRDLVASGSTLLLTTQYLEEADQLADEILVVDQGRAIARGTADELKAQVGGERIQLSVEHEDQLDEARRVLTPFAVEGIQQLDATTLNLAVANGAKSLIDALRALDEKEISLTDAGLRRPTLDDVFLTLTGKHAEGDDESPGTGGGDARPENRSVSTASEV